jgi:thiol-disulfide isomerase/thioredoxin
MANKKNKNTGRGPGGGRPDRPAETRKSQPTPKANARRQKTQHRPRQKSGDRWSWYILYAGVAALILGAGFLVWNAVSDQATGDASRTDFDLPALFEDGDRVRLADLDDKPTVVNFFASWCINCERELPDFVQAATEFGDEVNFVFVHTQETNSGVGRAFARQFGLEDFTVASDVGASKDGLSRNHGARGLPMTVLYDAGRSFQQPIRGELNYGQLVQLLREADYIDG